MTSTTGRYGRTPRRAVPPRRSPLPRPPSALRRALLPRSADRGSATAELAVALPAVLLLLLAGLTAVGAVTTKLQCVDASREAALAASRGGAGVQAGRFAAPDGAEVSVTFEGDTVVATVRAPVPLLSTRLPALTVAGTAVAAVEPGVSGRVP